MNKNIILPILLVFSLAFSSNSFCQKDGEKKEKKGSITYKMAEARHLFLENNYRGALLIYREVIKIEPKNAKALYRTAECHYAMKKYDLALKYLDKAKAEDAEVEKGMNFFYGKTYHRMARLDEAIASFNSFLQTAPKRSIEFMLAQRYIGQCEYAKSLMNEPVPVEIENVGSVINSRFDEYAPSVTADGKTLYFTSRRSDTEGGNIDENSDFKFFEDIYYSTWDEENKEWGSSESLPGDVNTSGYDAVLSVDPDGKSMYIYKNDDRLAGDIFVSQKSRTTDSWFAPEKLPKPINSSYYEGSVSITNDGKSLYFISERTEGKGLGDIYVSHQDKKGEWQKPKNLGDVINTEDDEKFVFIHPNGRTLYFASKGHQTMGSYDIFKSELVNGEWGTPVNLGYPINTVNEESTFSLTADNSTLFVAAEYEGSQGERDIYSVDVSDYSLISEGYDKANFATILGDVSVNGDRVKNAKVKFYSSESDRFVGEVTTSKEGRFRINLPGNAGYKIEVIYKGVIYTEELTAKLKEEGETVLKFSWSF